MFRRLNLPVWKPSCIVAVRSSLTDKSLFSNRCPTDVFSAGDPRDVLPTDALISLAGLTVAGGSGGFPESLCGCVGDDTTGAVTASVSAFRFIETPTASSSPSRTVSNRLAGETAIDPGAVLGSAQGWISSVVDARSRRLVFRADSASSSRSTSCPRRTGLAAVWALTRDSMASWSSCSVELSVEDSKLSNVRATPPSAVTCTRINNTGHKMFQLQLVNAWLRQSTTGLCVLWSAAWLVLQIPTGLCHMHETCDPRREVYNTCAGR